VGPHVPDDEDGRIETGERDAHPMEIGPKGAGACPPNLGLYDPLPTPRRRTVSLSDCPTVPPSLPPTGHRPGGAFARACSGMGCMTVVAWLDNHHRNASFEPQIHADH